jgi:hypothetical protein
MFPSGSALSPALPTESAWLKSIKNVKQKKKSSPLKARSFFILFRNIISGLLTFKMPHDKMNYTQLQGVDFVGKWLLV